ncbi:MAG: hypothetical protein WBB01_03605 [Phormidesmis sp.]
MSSSNLPGKDVTFEVGEDGLHIIFENEASAIEMMPKGPSVFERRSNVIVMLCRHPLSKQLRQNDYDENT